MTEIVSVVLTYDHLATPLWAQSRAESTSEFFATLEEQFLQACDSVSSAASPVIALTSERQNLMFRELECRQEPLFENIVKALSTTNGLELNRKIKEKISIIRQVSLDYKAHSDIGILEGLTCFTNQLAESSMGNLKRSYERRFNLHEESLCQVATAMHNNPVTYWLENDRSVLQLAFGRGVLKQLTDERKRARLSRQENNLQDEIERQANEAREAYLLERVKNFFPKSSSPVKLLTEVLIFIFLLS